MVDERGDSAVYKVQQYIVSRYRVFLKAQSKVFFCHFQSAG